MLQHLQAPPSVVSDAAAAAGYVAAVVDCVVAGCVGIVEVVVAVAAAAVVAAFVAVVAAAAVVVAAAVVAADVLASGSEHALERADKACRDHLVGKQTCQALPSSDLHKTSIAFRKCMAPGVHGNPKIKSARPPCFKFFRTSSSKSTK